MLALKPEASAEAMPTPERSAGGEFEANFAALRHEIVQPETAEILARIQEFDPATTFPNVMRVGLFVAKTLEVFSDEIQLNESEETITMRAAVLHDTGKMALPLSFWDKPGRFNDEENVMKKSHTSEGREALAGVDAFADDKLLLDLTLLHHQVQGDQYVPGELADWVVGEDVERFKTLLSLFAMSDQTEAMTSNRRYVEDQGFTKEDIVKNLKDNLAAFGASGEIADRIAAEPFFWDRELQQEHLDTLMTDFEGAKPKPERHLKLVGVEQS